jgi:tripartite-type tricarboxylate transporter receptor subunit TctC
MKRLFKALLAGLVAFSTFAATAADKYPEKPITILCGFTPGAVADAQLRALAHAMSRELKQPVIVDNRPGASATLAASLVARARPDGYTLVQVTNTVARQPFITPTNYDPVKDFTYVIGITTFDFGLVVDASSPWKTFQDFTGYAKQNPNKVSYGTIGIGSVPHQVMNRIAEKLGVKWTHVPYKGSAPAQADLQGGHIQALSDATGWSSLVDSGKMRLLAVYGDKRLKKYPNVPTLKELGLDISDESPWGLAAPSGVPSERIRIIHDAAKKALADPDFIASLDFMANEVKYMSTQQYQDYMAARVPVEKQIVDKYNLRQQ